MVILQIKIIKADELLFERHSDGSAEKNKRVWFWKEKNKPKQNTKTNPKPSTSQP